MANNDRFVKTYSQGKLNVIEIWVDRMTGVNYLYRSEDTAQDLPHCSTKTESPLLHQYKIRK